MHRGETRTHSILKQQERGEMDGDKRCGWSLMGKRKGGTEEKNVSVQKYKFDKTALK